MPARAKTGSSRASRTGSGLGAHLEAAGDEAGEGELVNVRGEAQAGPDRNLRRHGLGDAPSQGILVTWKGAQGEPEAAGVQALRRRPPPHQPPAPISRKLQRAQGDRAPAQSGAWGTKEAHLRLSSAWRPAQLGPPSAPAPGGEDQDARNQRRTQRDPGSPFPSGQ